MNGNIVKIIFHVGGFFGYDNFIFAVDKDRTATLFHESVGGRCVLPNDTKFSKSETKHFLTAFEKTGVLSWNRYYKPDCLVTDGIQWSVEIERKGKRKFVREGDNIFPLHWGKFCKLFGIYLDEIQTAVLELLINAEADRKNSGANNTVSRLSEKITVDFDGYRVISERRENNHLIFTSDTFAATSSWEWLNEDMSGELTHEWQDEPWQSESIGIPYYKLTVTRYDGTVIMHEGVYDKNHISEDWQDVMNDIRQFVPDDNNFYLLDNKRFYEVKSEGDRIFYSVEVCGTDKDYYYFSHDDKLEIGDEVLVPFGRENEQRTGEIIDIAIFSPDKLPYPVEKTKYIIRRLEPGNIQPSKMNYCPVKDSDIGGGDCMVISDVADRMIKPSVLCKEVKWDEEQRKKCLACAWHGDRNTHNEKVEKSEPIQRSFTEQDLIDAHRFSGSNQPELSKGEKCGCFYCLKIYNSKEITHYLTGDNDCDRNGTAFCPYCEIDSVIGESSGYPITEEFLSAMNKKWF